MGNKTTRTTKTEHDYNKRSRNIIRLFKAKKMVEISNTIEIGKQLVDYLQVKIDEDMLKPSSVRKISASIKYWAKENHLFRIQDALEENPLKSTNKTKTRKTSAKKVKRLPKKQWDLFVTTAQIMKGKYGYLIIDWIKSIELTGIRPSEWISIQVGNVVNNNKTEKVIRVINGKNSNNRTYGEFRNIILTDITDPEWNCINNMIGLAQNIRKKYPVKNTLAGDKNEYLSNEAIEEWEKIYSGCRKQITRINKAMPSTQTRAGNITLYSARHQFVADMKANDVSTASMAALLGHGSIVTATEHYGRKQFGKVGKFRVRPHSEDLKKVKKIIRQEHLDALAKQKDTLEELANKVKTKGTGR